MATILEFRAASKSRRSTARGADKAEIVIFPGVRVERWEGEARDEPRAEPQPQTQRASAKASAKSSRGKRTPRRDTLEILD